VNNYVVIIPARASSTRLPNKPLLLLNGQSLLSRVHALAKKSDALEVYIATDCEDIKNHAEEFGAKVVMTSQDHISGTDRLAEAATTLKLEPNQVILNLQGDEPFMPIEIMNSLPQYVGPESPIATACVPITAIEDIESPNEVKVVRTLTNRAMYFSRSIIPNAFTTEFHGYLKHLGIYAYSNDTLQSITNLPESEIELQEKLEQLRFLDHGYNIHVQDFDIEPPIGIDTQADLDKANEILIAYEKAQ